MVRPPVLRTRSVTTKITDAEYAQLDELVGASGLNLSEWVRKKLLNAGRSDGDANVLLGELLALRSIVINLLFSIANGERVTREQMQTLIERADSNKAAKTQALLKAIKAGIASATTKDEAE